MLAQFYAHLGALAALPAMREANPLELVLLGHSAGGAVALDVAGGCQQPWANAVYCAGYQSLNETALVGIAAWEGYLPMPVALDPGTFVPYFEGSESGAGTMVGMAAALRSTSTAGGNLTFASPAGAAADDPSCVGLVTVGGAGHFGITDYTPSTNASEGQVAPCAKVPSQPCIAPTQEDHNARLDLAAAMIGAGIKAGALQTPAAQQQLVALLKAPGVAGKQVAECMVGGGS
eukprot:scaffold9.g3078.t1